MVAEARTYPKSSLGKFSDAETARKRWLAVEVLVWLIPVLTFFAGFVILPLYRRLAHEGMSVQQGMQFRALSQNLEEQRAGRIAFETW